MDKDKNAEFVLLEKRQNQIDSWKDTLAYKRYISQIPKAERPDYLPRTPNKNEKMRSQQWNSCIKAWKLEIQTWYQRELGIEQENLRLAENSTKSTEKLSQKFSWEIDILSEDVVLENRQKQIDSWKNTFDYKHYIAQIPKAERPDYLPRTPNKNDAMQQQQWDDSIKTWKLEIHAWYQRDLEIEEENSRLAALKLAEKSSKSPKKSPRKSGN